jgi:hypothetical protein
MDYFCLMQHSGFWVESHALLDDILNCYELAMYFSYICYVLLNYFMGSLYCYDRLFVTVCNSHQGL